MYICNVCIAHLVLCSSSSHIEDAAEVDTPVRQEVQPVQAKDSEKPHVVARPPAASPVKEEPKQPKGPSLEPVSSLSASPKPDTERTALALEPLVPSKPEMGQREEPVVQPPGKPQQVGADEGKPADGRRSIGEEPVCEAEKHLWAAVEDTTTETAAERGMESNESAEEKEEEGVIGGWVRNSSLQPLQHGVTWHVLLSQTTTDALTLHIHMNKLTFICGAAA